MMTWFSDIAELSRDEGLQEGLATGQRNLVLRQLTRKFGALDAPLTERVMALAPESLLALSEALLDFSNPAELGVWLDQSAPTGAPQG